MKRKIKFIAWHSETAKMIDLHKITPLALSQGMKPGGLYLPLSDDSVIIMESSGHFDKNNKEIFEDYLIKAFNKVYDDAPSLNQVVLDKGCWILRCNGKNDIPLFNYQSSELEVVGHIHQNHEPLTP